MNGAILRLNINMSIWTSGGYRESISKLLMFEVSECNLSRFVISSNVFYTCFWHRISYFPYITTWTTSERNLCIYYELLKLQNWPLKKKCWWFFSRWDEILPVLHDRDFLKRCWEMFFFRGHAWLLDIWMIHDGSRVMRVPIFGNEHPVSSIKQH